MLWPSYYMVQMGVRTENYHFSWNPGDDSDKKYAFDSKSSNTTENGEWIFKISDGLASPAALRFSTWQRESPLSYVIRNSARKRDVYDCPCSLRQLYVDSRYKIEDVDLWNKIRCRLSLGDDRSSCELNKKSEYLPDLCAYHKTMTVQSYGLSKPYEFAAVVTRCCYSSSRGNLIRKRSEKDSPLTQWLVTNASSSQLVETEDKVAQSYTNVVFSTALQGDTQVFQDACISTTWACDLYYERRPIPNCNSYSPPKQGWLYLDFCLRNVLVLPYLDFGMNISQKIKYFFI